jgi:hypothetical protein
MFSEDQGYIDDFDRLIYAQSLEGIGRAWNGNTYQLGWLMETRSDCYDDSTREYIPLAQTLLKRGRRPTRDMGRPSRPEGRARRTELSGWATFVCADALPPSCARATTVLTLEHLESTRLRGRWIGCRGAPHFQLWTFPQVGKD